MNRILPLFFLLSLASGKVSNAQNAVYFENLESIAVGSVPAGWNVASNTDVAIYQRPGTCTVDNKGLETPGVGKGAPTGFVLPVYQSDAASHDVTVDFSIYVYDANLKCNTSKPFPCPTFVGAYIVPTTWNDPLGTPGAGQYYAALPNYQLVNANGSNTIIFDNVILPAGVTSYRVLLNFKGADNSNCSSSGTKFVFDDFGVNVTNNCPNNNCAPVAQQDYFNFDVQLGTGSGATTLKGNVYGGYAPWASVVPAGYELASLDYAPAVNAGLDYDLSFTPLAGMIFNQVGGLSFESGSGCSGTPTLLGSLTFNANGTFTYSRSGAAPCVRRVSFSYYIKNIGLSVNDVSATVKVIIDLPGESIILPVTFQSFNAVRNKEKVNITWETASEVNSKGFTIQRNDGNGWNDISFINTQAIGGNSSSLFTYHFIDINNTKGLSQYRIQQIDMDGKLKTSEIRTVRNDELAIKNIIHPNPSNTGAVTITFADNNTVRNVFVTDINGKTVKEFKGITTADLQITGLQKGVYLFKIIGLQRGSQAIEKVVVH